MSKKKKVLVLYENYLYGLALKKALESPDVIILSDWEIARAENLVKAEKFNLVILDLMSTDGKVPMRIKKFIALVKSQFPRPKIIVYYSLPNEHLIAEKLGCDGTFLRLLNLDHLKNQATELLK